MTDDMQSLRDDISYLKDLAQDGRDGTASGGMILTAAGGCFGVVSIAQWSALAHVGPLSMGMVSLLWMVALALFFLALFLTKRRQGQAGAGLRAGALSWQAVGYALCALFAALAIASWRTQSGLLINFSPCIVLALYGGAWSVAATVTRRRWLWLLAFGSFAGTLISAWLIGDVAQWLFYGIALFLLAFAPGLAFTLQSRGRCE